MYTGMAGFYKDGACGLKQSYVMAAMLYEKAVEQGDPGAMFNLACLYETGRGVAQSYIPWLQNRDMSKR